MSKIVRFIRRSPLEVGASVMAAFAVIMAGYALSVTMAASIFAQADATMASVQGGATIVDDSSAANGKAIQFAPKSTSETPPSTDKPVVIAAVSDMQYGPAGIDRAGVAKRAIAMNPDYLLMAGDLAYNGKASEYTQYNADYSTIKSKIRAVPGNHDNYQHDNALAYDANFSSTTHGAKPDYWYSFNAGAWHIVALNTGVDTATASYAVGSAQLKWLASDLDANAGKPTLLFFHVPRYTASEYSSNTSMQKTAKPIWDVALAHKADIIVNGHDHSYQRFAPMDSDGKLSAGGIREFIAATGGYSLRAVTKSAAPNLETSSTATNATWCGALKLSLYSNRYEWQFQNIAGQVLDSGSTALHAH